MDHSLILEQDFYCRSTLDVAYDLIGARLSRRLPNDEVVSGYIVEVEAYTQDDPACHAYRGKTKRTEVLFGPPGHAYVYFIYGMYFCLNVVTEPTGTPGAVLIRAVGSEGLNGPGKLCKNWQINSTHNGITLFDSDSELWISRGLSLKSSQIKRSNRIGISKAQDLKWRFYLKDSPYVSKPYALKRVGK